MNRDGVRLALAAVLVLGVAPPPAARAGEPRPHELRLEKRPPAVAAALPAAPAWRLRRDTAEALAEFRARERARALVEEIVGPPTRRPDLSRDVVEGLQARTLRDALRR